MRKTTRFLIPLIATTFLIAVALDASAQRARSTTRDPILRGNPYRDGGGSCVYDRDGRVVFSPGGKECRDRKNHLLDVDDIESSLVDSFPANLKQELRKLLSDHDHMAKEVARLQYVIREEKREDAVQGAEKVSAELREHTAREERFLEAIAKRR